ncbi:unnamed protein product, partial [marine sediment metagenome]
NFHDFIKFMNLNYDVKKTIDKVPEFLISKSEGSNPFFKVEINNSNAFLWIIFLFSSRNR